MMALVETVGAFLLVLGVLIFVHEAGHFLAAKAFGVEVPVFSLGIGPKLVGVRRGGTEYRISWFPLGGYVRLAGDESDPARTGAPHEFLSRPRWQRFLVFVAGPAANVALALVVTWTVLLVWGKDEVRPSASHPVVVAVAPGSPAAAAGIQPGDRLRSIAGRDARDPRTLRDEVELAPESTKDVVVEREGHLLSVRLFTGADPRYKLGAPGWALSTDSDAPPQIEQVLAGSPAEAAGLRPGDRIVAVEGETLGELELREVLAASPGRALRLTVERGGERLELTVVPADEGGQGRLGVLFRPAGLVHRELGPLAAAVEAVRVNLELTVLVFDTLHRMLRREISPRALSGPIEIAQVSRQAVRSVRSLLSFLAFISLQLGVFNLLPVPVLDGGHILILAVEGTLRRELSLRVKERVMQVGLVLLLAVFAMVLYLDVIKAFFSS